MPVWRLDPPFRYAIYVAFAVLFASGAAWLGATQMKTANGDFWQQASASLLMVHGGTAMLTLMLLGALFPLHISRAWRARKTADWHRHGHLQRDADRNRFRALLSRLGNLAMDERPSYRLWARPANCFFWRTSKPGGGNAISLCSRPQRRPSNQRSTFFVRFCAS